jgi:2-amino-4-hydroxy-6-hydroxymethyldihydropteridine diphosphokinase
MHRVVLGIGGNLGDRIELIRKAEELLTERMACINKSAVYETAAWGGSSAGLFLNRVLIMESELEAVEVLEFIQDIENRLGRKRSYKWGDRTMDIDILYFDSTVIKTERLEIPHPLLAFRNFVLVPLAEVLSHYIHPVTGMSQKELLENSTDKSEVRPLPDP